jgi:hypothetical protein
MAMDMRTLVETGTPSLEEIAAKHREIYETVLRESEFLDAGNFTTIHPDDVERLFDLYDDLFFKGGCRQLLGDAPLGFRLSKRMTQAGGQATRRERRDRKGRAVRTEYEIAVATTLLFQSFQEDDRPIVMSGIACQNRLEALQRVVEHEMTHLIEMLIWVDSSCTAPRFQSIANRFFGHTDHRHQLITPREHAFTRFDVKTGDRVSFRLDGQHYIGRVNRITKRATVLVESDSGPRYSDGKRYAKFYVPVSMLQTIAE